MSEEFDIQKYMDDNCLQVLKFIQEDARFKDIKEGNIICPICGGDRSYLIGDTLADISSSCSDCSFEINIDGDLVNE